jgi:hypothetical protein
MLHIELYDRVRSGEFVEFDEKLLKDPTGYLLNYRHYPISKHKRPIQAINYDGPVEREL